MIHGDNLHIILTDYVNQMMYDSVSSIGKYKTEPKSFNAFKKTALAYQQRVNLARVRLSSFAYPGGDL